MQPRLHWGLINAKRAGPLSDVSGDLYGSDRWAIRLVHPAVERFRLVGPAIRPTSVVSRRLSALPPAAAGGGRWLATAALHRLYDGLDSRARMAAISSHGPHACL